MAPVTGPASSQALRQRRLIAAAATARGQGAADRTAPAFRVVEAPSGPVARLKAGSARLLDRAATFFIGPVVPAYAGQIGGATGRVANRLAPGHSVMLAANTAATVPASVVAHWLPGVAALPDLGGSLRMAGMLARKNDGKLLLTLTFQAGESVSYAWGGGLSLGFGLGARRYGFKLGGERSVGAEAGQVVVATLKFDPAKPDDVARLRDLLESDGAVAFGPRLKAGSALSRALASNRQAIAVGGNLGGNLGASFGGTLGDQAADGLGIAAESPWKIKAKLGFLASAAGELFRTWDKNGAVTDMIGFEHGLEAAVKLPMIMNGKLSDRAAASFSVTRNQAGLVEGLAAVFTDGLSGRLGTPLGGGTLAGKVGTKSVLTRELNAEGVKAARTLIANGYAPLQAFRRLASDPALVDERLVSVASRQGVYGADFALSLGRHVIQLAAQLTAGKVEREAGDNEDPGLRELLAVMKSSQNRWGI